MTIRSAVIAGVLSCTLAAATLLAQSAGSPATSDSTGHWTVLIPSGVMVPTGEQRHAVKRGNMSAIQLAYAPLPAFAITSTVGWARSRDIATSGDPKLDVFTYDAGVEVRVPAWAAGNGVAVAPFAGMGAGGRSYNYRNLDVDATHNVAGYLSGGADLRIRRVGVRLEARDYVTGFKPLDGTGRARSANDVVVLAGLRLFSR